MNQLIQKWCTGLLMVAALQSCQKNELGVTINDGVAPGPVSNVTVQNLSGAAKISYTVPKDEDLLYVKAIYTAKDGTVRESKVSHYVNNLTVVGFAEAIEYEVKLYAVDKSENLSQPVSIKVNPLKPAYKLVRESLSAVANYGGIDVSFQNPSSGDMAIVVVTNDSVGRFVPYDTYYTNSTSGTFQTRGLRDVEAKFGIFSRDRWGNTSDTLLVTLKPMYETLLDRTLMKALVLPTDAGLFSTSKMSQMFDGSKLDATGIYTTASAPMPQWFTFDMGVAASVSRIKWWMRQGYYYDQHAPRRIEIYGSNNPNPNGSWDASWELLKTYEQIKPSGLPNGQFTAEDLAVGDAGENCSFPLNSPKVRYIRIKVLQNWSNGTYVSINELSVYGDPR